MTKLVALALLLIGAIAISGCKGVPGADGQYATHDHGNNNRP